MFNNAAAAVTTCTTGFDGVQTCSNSSINGGAAFAIGGGIWLFFMAVLAVMVVSQWKIFTKAGKPGWATLIPIYSNVVMLQIIGKPDWWVLLMLVPFVNIVIAIIIAMELAKTFGKSSTFGIFGLIFFPFIGYPMLAFGNSSYHGPSSGAAISSAPPLNPSEPAAPSPTAQ